MLAAAPYPEGLHVPELRCRSSWGTSASPLVEGVASWLRYWQRHPTRIDYVFLIFDVGPRGVHLPLPSWCPSASTLMEYICLSSHGVHLPLLSWCTSASPLMESVCLSPHGVYLPLPSRIGRSGWTAGCPRDLGHSWEKWCADLRPAPVLRRALTVPVSGIVVPGPGFSWPVLVPWDTALS